MRLMKFWLLFAMALVMASGMASAQSTTGKPDTPSCTTCHTQNPKHPGRTRAGKEIAAMALSVTPDRYGDAEKVEKWFARNCQSVLGRPCTAQEKGDFISFMIAQ